MPHVASEALLTLATLTAILKAGPVVQRGGSCLSVRGSMTIHSVTPGDGPWLCGYMNSDLSLAELEAFLELGGPLTPADITAVEVASRGKMIRTLGVMVPAGNGSSAVLQLDNRTLSGLRFSETGEATGAGWSYWMYNLGPAMATGAVWVQATQTFTRFNKSG